MIVYIIFIVVLILTFIVIRSVNNVNEFERAKNNEPNITREEYRGSVGEKQTAIVLDQINGYKHILNNMIFNDNGKTRQIDHIAITTNGVFVIETKNYSGKIYGSEYSKEWQQFLGNKSYNFKNPIHQNYGHVEIIKKVLQATTDKVYSVVVFTRKCKLKLTEIKTKVTYIDEVKEYIENQEKSLDITQVEEIYRILMENRVTNQEYIENNNYNVRFYMQGKKDKVANGICPRCNGKLVKKNGPYGEFYGCNNYPTCKYTHKVEF